MKTNLLFASQRGSTAFFVSAVVLPLVFFVFTLGLDLNKYFFERDRLQKAIDQAAFYSYRFLPFQKAAATAARSQLASAGLEAKISTSRDGIRIELNTLSQLVFAKYFAIDAGIPIFVSASARGPVLDVFLALDVSSYMAPDPLGDTAWGYPEDWPAAQYFMFDRLFYRDGKMISPQLISEQCFNPSFSELKKTAIELFEYFSSFSTSAIGLGFYPGAAGAIDIARPLGNPGRVAEEVGEAVFLDYQGRYQADLFCIAAAENEQTHSEYNFHNAYAPGSGYQPTAATDLTAREIIWGKSVMNLRYADTVSALREISNSLISGGDSKTRGSLVNSPQKLGILLSGDLPRVGGSRFPDASVKIALAEEFQKLRLVAQKLKSQISIYFVVIPTPEIEAYFTEIIEFFKAESTDDILKIKLLSGDSASITGAIMLDKQTVVISE